MTEENNLTSEAGGLPPASQKTKEQWQDEGNVLSFYAPVRLEEGLAAYEQAIRLDPTYVLAWRMRGLIPHALKRDEEALSAYEQVIRLDDDEPHYSYLACMNSTTILANLSRYDEALAASEGAIRLEPRQGPRSAHNYVSKGWLLERLARYDEALATYQEGSLLEPNNASIWRSIGNVLTALERAQEAQQAYEKARQLDSGEEV